jgi:hypothetical protein
MSPNLNGESVWHAPTAGFAGCELVSWLIKDACSKMFRENAAHGRERSSQRLNRLLRQAAQGAAGAQRRLPGLATLRTQPGR